MTLSESSYSLAEIHGHYCSPCGAEKPKAPNPHATLEKFDFTCVDVQPAVLARNALLISLVIDYYENGELESGFDAVGIWNLFYHFMIPDTTLALIHSQSEKLLAASHSFDSWKTCPYGKYIQFASKETYREVGGCWRKYADLANPTRPPTTQTQEEESKVRQRIRKIENDRLKRFGKDFRVSFENTGPFMREGMEATGFAMTTYWKTGTVGGDQGAKKILSKDGKGLLNPLFIVALHSFHGWDCHYAMDPLKGFYLAEAFQKPHEDKGDNVLASQVAKLGELARSQFFAWIQSFSRYIHSDRVTVRFWSAEALVACLALQTRLNIGVIVDYVLPYARPWSAAQILVGDQMHKKYFNVIESSNVVDYLGLLNVLVASRPLLSSKPDAALFSETLLRTAQDDASVISKLTIADIKQVGILLNLMPLGHLTGVSASSTLSQVACRMLSKDSPYSGRAQITWKIPALGDNTSPVLQKRQRTYIAPNQLTSILYDVFSNMFENENPTVLLANRMRAKSNAVSTVSQYSRASFVCLIQTLKLMVDSDWKSMMSYLLSMIGRDTTRLLGSNNTQEMQLQLQLARLCDVEYLRNSPRHGETTPSGKLRAVSQNTGFLAEELLPPIGFITLIVPRATIAKLTSVEGTPVLQARVKQTKGPIEQQYDNIFSTIHGMFGRLDDYRGNFDQCVMYENGKSWNGTSDLIVCFRAPMVSLLLGPKDGIRVALIVSQTWLDSSMYNNALGRDLCVFETGLDDPRVKLTRQHTIRADDDVQPPSSIVDIATDMERMRLEDVLSQTPQLTALMTPSDETRLVYHWSVGNDIEVCKALTAGKQVSVVGSSPCSISISIGENCSRPIAFPMPISRTNHKIRVARKSQWIEVTATVSLAGAEDGYNSNPFPVIGDLSPNHPSLAPWSLPYVPLDKCSKVPLEHAMDLDWARAVFGLGLSDAERIATKAESAGPMTRLKESINNIFLAAMGLRDKEKNAFFTNFQLGQRDGSGINTIFMVDAVRHDPTTQCIVLDAYVVPLTRPRVKRYYDALAKWQYKDARVLSIRTEPSETRLWKNFLPACMERCRTYSHKSSCEYKTDGAVPRSLEAGEAAICSCGEGKVSASFLKNPMHAPFAKIATRVAIAPLFPVPYVEECFGILKRGRTDLFPEKKKKERGPNAAALERCFECGKQSSVGKGGVELKDCAKCRKVAYCGRECQAKSWPSHRKSCKA